MTRSEIREIIDCAIQTSDYTAVVFHGLKELISDVLLFRKYKLLCYNSIGTEVNILIQENSENKYFICTFFLDGGKWRYESTIKYSSLGDVFKQLMKSYSR